MAEHLQGQEAGTPTNHQEEGSGGGALGNKYAQHRAQAAQLQVNERHDAGQRYSGSGSEALHDYTAEAQIMQAHADRLNAESPSVANAKSTGRRYSGSTEAQVGYMDMGSMTFSSMSPAERRLEAVKIAERITASKYGGSPDVHRVIQTAQKIYDYITSGKMPEGDSWASIAKDTAGDAPAFKE